MLTDIRVTPTILQLTVGEAEEEQVLAAVFSERPADPDELARRGELFLAVSLTKEGVLAEIDLAELMRQAWQKFRAAYFDSAVGSALSGLQASRERVLAELQKELTQKHSWSRPLVHLSLNPAVVWGRTLYALTSSEFYFGWQPQPQRPLVWRRESVSHSLELKDGQVYVLLSRPFFELLSRGQADPQIFPQLSEWRRILFEQSGQKGWTALLGLVWQSELVELPGPEEVIEIAPAPVDYSWSENLKVKLGRKAGVLLTHWGKLFFSRPGRIYLKAASPKRSALRWALPLGLLLLLLLSAALSFYRGERQKQKEALQQNLREVQEQIQAGQTLLSLNPNQARQVLQEAQSALAKAGEQGRVLAAFELNQEFEQTQKELAELLEQGYQTQVLAVQTGAALSGEDSALAKPYFYQAGQGVVGREDQEVVVALEPSWGEIVDLELYLGSVYLLDRGTDQIHKYLVLEGGFSKHFDYFRQPAELQQVLDFAIDGSIYLLFEQGRVEKFLGGERVDFGLTGLYPSLAEARQIYTRPELDKLYLADGGFILVFDKEGVYEKRYQLEGVEEIEQILKVDEAGGEVWVESERKVYEASF